MKRYRANYFYCFYFLFFLLLLPRLAISSGFAEDTLVKTPTGYCCIGQISPGDEVITFDYERGRYVTNCVGKVVSHTSERCIRVVVADVVIVTDYDQRFYSSNNNCWLSFSEVTLNDQSKTLFTSEQIDSVLPIKEPIVLFDLVVETNHNFCVTTHDIIVHNLVEFAFGSVAATAFFSGASPVVAFAPVLAPAAIGVAAGWIIGGKIVDHLRERRAHALTRAASHGEQHQQFRGCASPDPDDPKKKRKINKISKKEFFNKIEKDYKYWKNGVYRRKTGARGIDNVEYFRWDHLHGDVEAYSRGRDHLGSYDPEALVLYKDAKHTRKLFLR